MPVYEYVCNDCSQKFDALVRSLDAADSVTCRACSGDNVKRLISSFAMVGGLDQPLTMSQNAGAGGGCCGGSCGCGH